ncbi:MAG: protein-glutamate O-methyltransferase CheR [candidate division FCPU426 bacterium]
MITEPEDRQFNLLLNAIWRKAGLDASQYKISYLKRRLAVRMRATQSATYADYRRLLEGNPQEYANLLDRLTINVSTFFRDPGVYGQIKRKVIPLWQDRARIRVWSAGCAHGQEPYSLAISLSEGLPVSCQWSILATDIDPTVLELAKAGRYSAASIKPVQIDLRAKYFIFEGEERVVKPELKRRVECRLHDLTGSLPDEQFDLIVCRNVLIYFIGGLQERLFKGFHTRLRSGGFLVLGKTETLLGEMRRWFDVIDIRERIYQRRETPV